MSRSSSVCWDSCWIMRSVDMSTRGQSGRVTIKDFSESGHQVYASSSWGVLREGELHSRSSFLIRDVLRLRATSTSAGVTSTLTATRARSALRGVSLFSHFFNGRTNLARFQSTIVRSRRPHPRRSVQSRGKSLLKRGTMTAA